VASPEGALMSSKWPWILGGIFGGGVILLFASEAQAAPARRAIRGTIDEDLFNDALRRLNNFIGAAKIDARAYKIESSAGMVLGVQPGARFVVEDSRALPKTLDGVDIIIKGWPR
jgi:hypothetical protein